MNADGIRCTDASSGLLAMRRRFPVALRSFAGGVSLALLCAALLGAVYAIRQLGLVGLAIAGDTYSHTAAMKMLAPFCHQIPSRCYWINGVQMPCCARCVGIYAGALAGVALYVCRLALRWGDRGMVGGAIVATADIAAKLCAVDASAPWRTTAGAIGGAVLMVAILRASKWLWSASVMQHDECSRDGSVLDRRATR